MFRALVLLFAAQIGLAACNPVAVIESAGEEVQQFQSDWGEGDIDAIWRGTDPELRKIVERERFERMLTDFGEIFGELRSTKRENTVVGTYNGDTTATIIMRSQYANGEVLETYVYRQKGERMTLLSYDAQSPLLDDYDTSRLQGDGLIYKEAPQ